MTLTQERIAEIEADLTSGAGPGWPIETNEEAAELCRLARLGLRVESAPTAFAREIEEDEIEANGVSIVWGAGVELPWCEGGNSSMIGKRVALVVLDQA